jgi:hypothetical protein
MARHYSTKDFFRQMPNDLLARYFGARGLFHDLGIGGMKESKPEALFSAWLELPENRRHAMDAEFAEIFEMSCEKGWVAIRDEAQWQMREDSEKLDAFITSMANMAGHPHRAMLTFLNHLECWKGATRFYHADNLAYWRKRKHMGNAPAAVDDASIQALAIQIRDFFRHAEGRGNNCVVEPFRRGELDYFFAYPEDYSQQSIEWVEGEFDRRPHTPAFEVIYVYSQKDGTLDLNYRGSNKAIEPLQGIFATTILKLNELPSDPEDARVYDLAALSDRFFGFVRPLGSGIESVAVKKLRLSSKVKQGDRITLEADPKRDPHAVHVLLDKLAAALPLNLYNVTQAELVALVVVDEDKPAKTISIKITYPNSCSLKYDEVGLKLRAMLEASGIEPKEPADEPCAQG